MRFEAKSREIEGKKERKERNGRKKKFSSGKERKGKGRS